MGCQAGVACSSSLQMPAAHGTAQHWGMGVKVEQAAQANTQGPQMHRTGSMSGPSQQQQQQMVEAEPQGLPSRPGSSAGMAAGAAAMPAQSPEPAALSPNMSMLCAQLQQENMLLMHKLHQMEHQIGGSHPAASPAPAVAAGPAAAAAPSTEQSMAHIAPAIPGQSQAQQQAPASAAGAAAAAQPPASAAGMSWGGFDALLPQLRPVLTRVGGSAGGGLIAGGSLGGLCPADLVAESPAQLINTAFLDDHGLLGGL